MLVKGRGLLLDSILAVLVIGISTSSAQLAAQVNRSLALIFTSTQSLSNTSTIQKLFGDPEYYVDRWATGYRTDLALSLESISASTRENLFGKLSYDFNKQLLFFSDIHQLKLSFGAYIHNNNTNFYNFNPTQVSNQVNGMSIDWVSYQLYWVDGHYKRISVVSLNLILMWKPIIDRELNSPQDVAVNPQNGYLFWSDAGPQPKIERSTLGGLDRRTIVPSSRLTSPSTLTIDFQGQRLFWLDSGSNSIGCSGFDGSNINIWSHSDLSTAAGFTLYKNLVFVGDKLQPKLTIYKVTEGGLNYSTNIPVQGLNGIIDMTFYAKSNQPTTLNSPCLNQNGGCSHFCFTVPPYSRTCQCSVGFIPSANNFNCTIEPFTDDFVIVADTMQRNIFQVRPETGEVRALLPHSIRFPTAVDFDFLHKYVYWVDNKTNAIGKVSLDGRLNDYIYQYISPVAKMSGIAVDPVRELLYYTDSGLGRIVQMSTLGTNVQLLHTQAGSAPKSIVIDVTLRRLYWSTCGQRSAIRRADITDNGLGNISSIVSTSGGCPSIAIDTDGHKIFWIDSDGKVFMANDDGTEKSCLYTEREMAPGAKTNIAVTKDHIFISNSMVQWLTRIDRVTLKVIQQNPLTLFHTPGGIATSAANYSFPEHYRDNFLIVVDASEQRRNLYQIDIDSGSMIPLLITRPINPVALAFDPEEKAVYWTDVQDGFIGKYSLSGSRGNSTIIYENSDGKSPLDALAIDTVNRKLYCSDAGISPKIMEMNLDGSGLGVVVSGDQMKPRALVVDVVNRDLYSTDWGDEPGIYRINLRIRQRTRILSDNMVWPNALEIDFSEGMMYWADAHIDRIEMARLDGSGRMTLVTETNAHYFGIALSQEFIYFTDWIHGAVRRLNRQTRQLSEQRPRTFGKLYGIIYYNSSFSNVRRTRSNASASFSSTRNTSPPIVVTVKELVPSSSIAKVIPDSPKSFTTVKSDSIAANKEASTAKIDHTMVIVIAVVVGGVVLITAMIMIGVCVTAKRRRISSYHEPRYVTPRQPNAEYCHNTLTGSRSSNTYEYIPYATGAYAMEIESPDGGYLNPTATSLTDDYLKPIGAYYTKTEDSAKTDLFYSNTSFKQL